MWRTKKSTCQEQYRRGIRPGAFSIQAGLVIARVYLCGLSVITLKIGIRPGMSSGTTSVYCAKANQ